MPTVTSVLAVTASIFAADPPTKPLTPVPFTDVTLGGDFWGPRLAATRRGTLAQNFEQCEKTGRIDNLRHAAAGSGEYKGYFFNDSDVFKAIEGACYQLALAREGQPNADAKFHADIDKQLDDLIAIIAKAQRPDGYINSYFQLKEGLDKRWTNEADKHETYCMGHLIEAGVAHFQATGKRTLLDVSIKAADHIASIFGHGKRAEAPGHQEIELALIKLAQVTGQKKYFDLAQFFIECRGVPRPTAASPKPVLYGEYCQDQLPVRLHSEAVGHAVRAMYLYSAVTDIAAVTGDKGYLGALDRVWDDVTLKKMYVTGGIGPSAHNEGFTFPYDLPNDSAYAETCASIGLAMWAHRMALLHRDAKYFDIFERVLYNGILSGVSLDGRKFFYVNPLASHGKHHRRDWYECACCPPNVLRFLSSLGGYAYATDGDTVYVNMYAQGTAKVKLASGDLTIRQETAYPWDGKVKLHLVPSESNQRFTVKLRRPWWSSAREYAYTIKNPTRPEVVEPWTDVFDPERATNRYLVAGAHDNVWNRDDYIDIDFGMKPQLVHANPNVKQDLGRVALQRGPLIYCLEQADNKDGVRNLALKTGAEFTPEWRPDLLGGVTVLKGQALRASSAMWNPDALYAAAPAPQPVEVTAIPYYAWDNRDPGEMVVWLPEAPSLLTQPPPPDITASASHCFSRDSVAAMLDPSDPKTSSDNAVPHHSFWDRKGTTEWVQLDFRKPRSVSACRVYWFDDSPHGGCRVPASWRVLTKTGETWTPLECSSIPGCEMNMFNGVRFAPTVTTAVRIEATLQSGFSGGVIRWRVD